MKLDFLEEFQFFTGVPDSQLKPLCNYLISRYGIGANHIIAANEGNCVALAAGYHLSTGKVPVVYLQNSGIGNIINPLASLMNENVYGIPCLFIVGWRGEPGINDEPQHIYQGAVTLKLLHDMDIDTSIVDRTTEESDVINQLKLWKPLLDSGKQVALVVKKGTFEFDTQVEYTNKNLVKREEAIKHIIHISKDDPIISTTGKSSRELFELREANSEDHSRDFLTVGSMGHASSIALSVAINEPMKRIWCIDGDGAAIMHMGAMAVIGSNAPNNLVHIIMNNYSHESVGGMPTVAENIDFVNIAKSCGYSNAISVCTYDELDSALINAKNSAKLTFIEIRCAIGSRNDLGRPTTSARENKINFMNYLKNTI